MDTILHSERLVLKVLHESHEEAVLNYVQRNGSFHEQWGPLRDSDYYTIQVQRKLLQEESDQIKNGRLFKAWLYKVSEPEQIMGSIALSNIVRGIFQSCYLGYQMDEHECGKGFMTEALKRLIVYTFEELQLHRIEANIMPRNAASLKVVEKLGFYEEGIALKYLKINGVWEDHIHMVLRNEAME